MEITETVKISNRLGFHLRAAAEFVKTSSRYKCRIMVRKDYQDANGKSLMNLMALAASYGTELTLIFEGDDASAARDSLKQLVMNRFGERE